LKKSSNTTVVLVAHGVALTVFADCGATPGVMKSPRIDQVIVWRNR